MRLSMSESKNDHRISPGLLRFLLGPVLPLVILGVLAVSSMARKSATYDEAILLASGARFIRSWDNSVNSENPPLLKAFYALPTLLVPDLQIPPATEAERYSYSMADGFAYGNTFLYGQKRPRLILFICRLMVVLTTVFLGLAVYAVALRVWNRPTAGIMLWVFALSPNLLA